MSITRGLTPEHVADFHHLATLAADEWTPCTGRDEWTSEDGEDQRRAARYCRHCPILTECRRYGLTHPGEFGVYGGLTTKDRDERRKEIGL